MESQGSRVPWWTWVLLFGVIAFSVLFFFQTRDPMLLIFGIIAGAMVFLVAYSIASSGRTGGHVHVRCRTCRALNPESAKHCMECGQKM